MADQIRQLAEESANSAVESKKLIEESMNEVEVGNKVTKETNDAMQEVMAELDQIIQEVANIRTASDKQAASVKNIKRVWKTSMMLSSPTLQQPKRLLLPARSFLHLQRL